MFTYALKNLKSLFLKQRLLSLLLVMNIVVSCLVICFSYGLYQNYNMIVQKGEEEELTELDVRIKSEDTYAFEPTGLPTADIEPQMFIDFAKMLSAETQANIDSIMVSYFLESPLYCIHTRETQQLWEEIDWDTVGNNFYRPEYFIYTDDADTAYAGYTFCFRAEGDKIVDAYYVADIFDDERYNNGDNIVAIADYVRLNKKSGGGIMYSNGYSIDCRQIPYDVDSIIIGDERFEITYTSGEEGLGVISSAVLPITAVPKDAAIEISKVMGEDYGIEGQASCFYIFFKDTVTGEQYNDVKSCLDAAFGGKLFLPPVEFTDAVEIYYYKTIMLISVVIAILAAINMAILYRYILEKRSGELAIFRICGCSKGKAIVSYLLECMIINIPLFALTQLCYHKLIMPKLTGLFPNMQGAYSMKLYAAIFGIYIGASMLIMLIMIALTIWRHSLVALKSAPKATNKFGIMKVFEIAQLSAVLSIMVLIVSAIMSRYELYTPFKQYFERKGYMVQVKDYIYLADFKDITGDSELIITDFDAAVDDARLDPDTGLPIVLYGIRYSDEFIKAYAPPLEDGIWLSDATDSYETTGYIPVVISSCEERYKVGDTFESDIIGYTDKDETILLTHLKYKVVGVLKDKVSVASYIPTSLSYAEDPFTNDFRDIYNVLSDSFEENDYLLLRLSDTAAYMSTISEKASSIEGMQWEDTGGALGGTQFVFCGNMTDEEYEELGKRLNARIDLAVPLSEVRKNSLDYIYEQMYTLFPIAACIFILTIISTVSISAIYTKRQLRNYAIFYICGARWRTCALKSLKNGAITCAVSAALSALILIIGKATFLSETVISFGIWHLAVCAGVIVLYLALSMIMPLSIIGSAEPREVLKEE